MHDVIHILNGDALAERFPDDITGTRMIMRECMAIGSSYTGKIEDIFDHRAKFLRNRYPEIKDDYYTKMVIPEFEKLQKVGEIKAIYLWFENDLFCQVNLWFIITYLDYLGMGSNLYLIEPIAQHPYSFAHHSTEDMIDCFKNASSLANNDIYHELWGAYSAQNILKLQSYLEIQKLDDKRRLAIRLAIDMLPHGEISNPFYQTCRKILEDLVKSDFSEFFKMFSQRFPQYGFGDLEMKHVFEQLYD